MANNRIEGTGKSIGGSIKKWVGKLTGKKRLEGEGRANKAEGKIQSTVGKAQDKIRRT